ncbi:hypothetical protein JCM10213_000042 [Rhodosporidiobolus nylandii]
MVPPLPLELELYILDLALPLPTPKRLRDRRLFLKTLSLIRRAWRPYAQKKLFAFPKVDNRVDRLQRWTVGVGMRRIDAVEVEYRVGDGRTLLQTLETVRQASAQSRTTELLLRAPDYPSTLRNLWPNLDKLTFEMMSSSSIDRRCLLSDLPPALTYLSLHRVALFWVPSCALNHLTTLLLSKVDLYDQPDDFLAAFPSLQSFAWVYTYASIVPFLRGALPPKLQHLYLMYAPDGLTQELEKLETPLASLSVVLTHWVKAEVLEPWCAANGVRFRMSKEEKVPKVGEPERIDIEEWARSL